MNKSLNEELTVESSIDYSRMKDLDPEQELMNILDEELKAEFDEEFVNLFFKIAGQELVENEKVLSLALRALCLTRDYVGERLLPAVDGWEWYEAAKAISVIIPEDEWVLQFARRIEKCPYCKGDLKFPQTRMVYCEDCNWPESKLD